MYWVTSITHLKRGEKQFAAIMHAQAFKKFSSNRRSIVDPIHTDLSKYYNIRVDGDSDGDGDASPRKLLV